MRSCASEVGVRVAVSALDSFLSSLVRACDHQRTPETRRDWVFGLGTGERGGRRLFHAVKHTYTHATDRCTSSSVAAAGGGDGGNNATAAAFTRDNAVKSAILEQDLRREKS